MYDGITLVLFYWKQLLFSYASSVFYSSMLSLLVGSTLHLEAGPVGFGILITLDIRSLSAIDPFGMSLLHFPSG